MYPAKSRRGMTLIELTISLVILGAAMAALVQLVALAARQRRSMAIERACVQEVANQAERIALLPWDDTAAGKLTAWQPSEDLAAILPAAQCTIAVSDEPGAPQARRIRLEIAWTGPAGVPAGPVSLTVWRHAEEAKP
jgi:prepilin-type N-terminal cleavage/methylation domain-containing protein